VVTLFYKLENGGTIGILRVCGREWAGGRRIAHSEVEAEARAGKEPGAAGSAQGMGY